MPTRDYGQGKFSDFLARIKGQAHYGSCDNGPHGGVLVMVRRGIPFQAIYLQTRLQAKAVRIGLSRLYTVASSYHPPHNLNKDALEDLGGLAFKSSSFSE